MSFDLEPALIARQQQGLCRQRLTRHSAQQPLLQVDGVTLLSFCSNDYLGLANHPDVIQSFQQAANQYGVGGGASHLVTGHSAPHHQLEEALAAFTGRDRALLFSSGYMANLGVINALMHEKDAIFQDRLNHASLLDAGQLSSARSQRYLHCDTNNLATRLARSEAQRKLLVTDGVFSMDGNIAPLVELAALAQQHHAYLMVDDAHGFGVLGQNGAGSSERFGLDQNTLPILMGTLGKACGTAGAFVAGSHELIETLIQFSRSYIYTTALPPAVAAATLTSLQIVQQQPQRREHLQQLIHYFQHSCQQLGLPVMPSQTPIQPLLVGEEHRAITISEALQTQGILVTPIRPPTVAKGTSRLRVTLSASHTQAQVMQLLDALQQCWHVTENQPCNPQ